MTVAELIKLLEKMPQDAYVYASDDEEINGTHDIFAPELMVATVNGVLTREDAEEEGYLPEEMQEVVVL